MSNDKLTAVENLENYLEKTPLVLNGGIITDNKALRKMEAALREAHKEYGFDKLIVDAHDIQDNPITLVMDFVPVNTVKIIEPSKKDVAERKAIRHYEVVPMKFGFKCNLDILGNILADVEVKNGLDEEKVSYLKNSNTFYTKSAYIGTAMFAEFMKSCTSGAYGKKP
jgi:hypothetical protein